MLDVWCYTAASSDRRVRVPPGVIRQHQMVDDSETRTVTDRRPCLSCLDLTSIRRGVTGGPEGQFYIARAVLNIAVNSAKSGDTERATGSNSAPAVQEMSITGQDGKLEWDAVELLGARSLFAGAAADWVRGFVVAPACETGQTRPCFTSCNRLLSGFLRCSSLPCLLDGLLVVDMLQ
jgi:hypothetical protein